MREEGTKAHRGCAEREGKGGDRKTERGVPGGGRKKKKRNRPTFRKRQQRRRQRPAAARLQRGGTGQRATHGAQRPPRPPGPPAPHRPALTLRHPAQPQDVLGPDGLQLQQFGFGPRRSAPRGCVRRPASSSQAAQGPPAPRRRLLVGSRRRPRPGAAHRPAAAAKMAAASRRSYGSGGGAARVRGRGRCRATAAGTDARRPPAPAPRRERPPRHSDNRIPFICLPRAAGRNRRAVDFRTSPPPDAVGKCKNKAATEYQK